MKMKMMRKLLGLAILLIVGDSQGLELCKGRKSYDRNDEPCKVRKCRAITQGVKYKDADKCIRAPTCAELRDSDDETIRKKSKKCRTLPEQQIQGQSQCLQARQGFPFVMTTNGGNEVCEGSMFWYSFCVTAEQTDTSKITIKEIRKTKLKENEELFAVGSMKAGCAGLISDNPFRPYSRRCGLTYSVQYLQEALDKKGELFKKTIISGGIERSYWVYHLNANGNSVKHPLVIDLHDFHSCAEILSLYSGWMETAWYHEKMAVVWPQGVETFGRIDGQLTKDVTSWAAKNMPFPATDEDIDDTSFLLDMINDLLQGNNGMHIDPDLIYMAGHGNGAFMAQQFAFEHPQLVAGVATHAGFLQALPDLDGNMYDIMNYANANSNVVFSPTSGGPFLNLVQKVPIVNIHGTSDEIVSLEQGGHCPGGGGPCIVTIGAQANHEQWAVLNGVGGKPEVVKLPELLTVQTLRATDDSVGVQLITVSGASHDSVYENLCVKTTRIAWEFLQNYKK